MHHIAHHHFGCYVNPYGILYRKKAREESEFKGQSHAKIKTNAWEWVNKWEEWQMYPSAELSPALP